MHLVAIVRTTATEIFKRLSAAVVGCHYHCRLLLFLVATTPLLLSSYCFLTTITSLTIMARSARCISLDDKNYCAMVASRTLLHGNDILVGVFRHAKGECFPW